MMANVFEPDRSKPLLPQVIAAGLLPLTHVMPDGSRVMDALSPAELADLTAGLPVVMREALQKIHKPRRIPMQQIILLGVVAPPCEGWATKNWPRMLVAHPGELTDFVPGTFNIDLHATGQWGTPVSWEPPDDEKYSWAARARPEAREFDFVMWGNYLHPDVVVRSIEKIVSGSPHSNRVDVAGRIYYPGGLHPNHKYEKAGKRTRIELVSPVRLRDAIGLADGDRVRVLLEVTAPSPAPAGPSRPGLSP